MKVITVGRSSQCDETITGDSQVSRFHAQIINENGEYTIIDTGSTNGTFVNGQRIAGRQKLNPRDVVRIGNTTIPWLIYFSRDNNRKPAYVGDGSSQFQTSINNGNAGNGNSVSSGTPREGNEKDIFSRIADALSKLFS